MEEVDARLAPGLAPGLAPPEPALHQGLHEGYPYHSKKSSMMRFARALPRIQTLEPPGWVQPYPYLRATAPVTRWPMTR